MSNLLNEMELGTLKGMAIYWREVAKRDDTPMKPNIQAAELSQVIYLLGAEKVLQLIAEYVEDKS